MIRSRLQLRKLKHFGLWARLRLLSGGAKCCRNLTPAQRECRTTRTSTLWTAFRRRSSKDGQSATRWSECKPQRIALNNTNHHSLGEAQPLEYHGTSWSTSTKIDDKPFATFVFRYRSRNALKAEYIISRTVSPEPLEDRPVEALTADEARELVRRLRVSLSFGVLFIRGR